MKNERIAAWDNIKFFLIFLVVAGHLVVRGTDNSHLYQSIFTAIYAFHMPLFIFISGVFYNTKKAAEKTIGYLGIFVIMRLILFVTEVLEGEVTTLDFFSFYGAPWFLFGIAVFTLLTYLLRNVRPVYILIVSAILGLFIGYDPNIGDFLALSRIIVFYPFFILGTMLNRSSFENLLKKKSLKFLGLGIILLWIVLCFVINDKLYFLRPLFTGRNPYFPDLHGLGFLYRLLCYCIAAIVGLAFMFLIPTRKIPVITEFGQHTLGVYFWHWIIINLAVALGAYGTFFSSTAAGKVLWLALSIPLTLLCSLKCFDYPAKWLLKPFKKTGS
ncbi:MAG: acyltransferase family protein [Parasporobacterium sp.]|nr:acyltransferase family protein [Parasporobacterium sp.]